MVIIRIHLHLQLIFNISCYLKWFPVYNSTQKIHCLESSEVLFAQLWGVCVHAEQTEKRCRGKGGMTAGLGEVWWE